MGNKNAKNALTCARNAPMENAQNAEKVRVCTQRKTYVGKHV
jgi:hypothetical protein